MPRPALPAASRSQNSGWSHSKGLPSKDEFLMPTCAVTLVCRGCLKIAFSELDQSFTQCQIPLGNNETENHSLVRQVLLEELENGDPTNRGNNASAKKSG